MLHRLSIDSIGNVTTQSQASSSIDLRIAFQPPCPQRQEQRRHQSQQVRQLLISQLAETLDQDYTLKSLPLSKTSLGKPYLTSQPSPAISLAHSHGWAASSLSVDTEGISLLGVDIEAIRHRDWEAFAAEVFHPKETAWLMAARDTERDRRGLTIWCRKEAILKAIGVGIAFTLSEIAVSPAGQLIQLPISLGSTENWNVVSNTINAGEQQAIFAVAWKSG